MTRNTSVENSHFERKAEKCSQIARKCSDNNVNFKCPEAFETWSSCFNKKLVIILCEETIENKL